MFTVSPPGGRLGTNTGGDHGALHPDLIAGVSLTLPGPLPVTVMRADAFNAHTAPA